MSCKTTSAWSILTQECVHQQACPTEAGHWELTVPPPFQTGLFPFIWLKITEIFFWSLALHGPGPAGTGLPWAWSRSCPAHCSGIGERWFGGHHLARGSTAAALEHRKAQREQGWQTKKHCFGFFPLIKYKLLESRRFFTECVYMHLSYNCILSLHFCCSKPHLKTWVQTQHRRWALSHVWQRSAPWRGELVAAMEQDHCSVPIPASTRLASSHSLDMTRLSHWYRGLGHPEVWSPGCAAYKGRTTPGSSCFPEMSVCKFCWAGPGTLAPDCCQPTYTVAAESICKAFMKQGSTGCIRPGWNVSPDKPFSWEEQGNPFANRALLSSS